MIKCTKDRSEILKKILIIVFCLFCICGCGKNKMYEEISEKEMETLLEEELYVLWNKENIEEITDNERLTLAIKKYAKNNNLDYYEIKSVNAKDVEDAFKTTSIGYLKLNHQNIKGSFKITTCEHNEWEYDNSTEVYTNAIVGHGICASKEVYHKLISFEEKNGKYIAVYKSIFNYSCEGDDSVSLYGSYEDAVNNQNKLTEINSFEYSTEEEFEKILAAKYEDIKNDLMTYTYTFEKTNGKITLVDFNRK